MSDLLFDTPWWVLGALTAVGIGLFIAGNNRLDKAMKTIGIVSVGLAIALLISSWLIDTNREKCAKNSRLLVNSVVKQDWATLSSLVAPQFRASILNTEGLMYHSREDFVGGVKAAVNRFDLKAAHIASLDAVEEGTQVKVVLSIYSEQGMTMGTMVPSGWEFDWESSADGKWQMVEMIAIRIGQESGDKIRGDFPRGNGG